MLLDFDILIMSDPAGVSGRSSSPLSVDDMASSIDILGSSS